MWRPCFMMPCKPRLFELVTAVDIEPSGARTVTRPDATVSATEETGDQARPGWWTEWERGGPEWEWGVISDPLDPVRSGGWGVISDPLDPVWSGGGGHWHARWPGKCPMTAELGSPSAARSPPGCSSRWGRAACGGEGAGAAQAGQQRARGLARNAPRGA
jgi:hypothetical protein